MARKNKILVANMTEAVNVTDMNADAMKAIMAEEILAELAISTDLELEAALNEGFEPEGDLNIAQAVAQANGADEALAQAAAQAEDEDEAPAAGPAESKSFLEQRDAVTAEQVEQMQKDLIAAFADRASYERVTNPNNDNIQETLTKVQKGHLAHAISQGFVAAGVDPNYLNKSEVSGKRRNVYALQKLQDLIYGASSGHLKNAINIAILATMVKLERAQIAFTGAIAKAAASDKVPVEANLKTLLVRHTVSESTASTQSSSTMTALEDLGAVINHGTQKHPVWTFADTALAKRLREVVETKHLLATV